MTKAMELATTSTAAQIDALPGPQVFAAPMVHAVAVNAAEMAESSGMIREFLVRKVAECERDERELSGAVEVAVKAGWATTTLMRQAHKATHTRLYYDKLLAAVDAGFTIVPNMPCDQFAIRVKRTHPSEGTKTETSRYGRSRPFLPDEKADTLPAGLGHYESPLQTVNEVVTKETNGKGEELTRTTVFVENFADITFPLAAAVPVVMNATHAAMSLKLFDRFAIVPPAVKNQDPIILGQIIQRISGREKVASFLIAWHLDLRTL